jgi:hypothetical protein
MIGAPTCTTTLTDGAKSDGKTSFQSLLLSSTSLGCFKTYAATSLGAAKIATLAAMEINTCIILCKLYSSGKCSNSLYNTVMKLGAVREKNEDTVRRIGIIN